MGCERPPVFCGLVAARVVVVIVPLPPAAVSRGAPCVAARWLACGPLLVLLLFVASSDAAWEVRLVPAVSAAAEYSDNVTGTTKQAQQINDLSFVTAPALTWILDRQDVRVDGRSDLRAERFLDHGDLDGENWGHRLGATWRMNERWTLSADENWRESRDVNEFIAAGEIVVQRQRRTTNQASAVVTWLPTEQTRGELSYTNYDSQSEDPRYQDYLAHMARASVSLQATEKLSLFTGADFQDYDFNPFPNSRTRLFTRNYGLFVGGGYQFSERLNTSIQVGGRLTEQTVRYVEPDTTAFPRAFTEVEDTTSNTGETFDLSATYQLDRGRIEAHASQNLTATSGTEGTVERRTYRVAASKWFAPDWQWNATISYTENKSDSVQTGLARNSHGTHMGAGLRYRINDYLDVSAQLRRSNYRNEYSGAVRNTETERNAALLTITGHWPVSL